jgi:hypothetical protein
VSTHRAIAGLFAFGSPDWAAAPAVAEDDRDPREAAGESAAVRVLYQAAPKKKPARPTRGKPIRDFIASVLEVLMPRPAPVPVLVRVPTYGRGR